MTNDLVETPLGPMPKSFTAPASADQTFNFGYPAAGKYHGNDLTYCADQIFNDPNREPDVGLACDMTGGSSGGPWLGGFKRRTGRHGRLGQLVRLQRPDEYTARSSTRTPGDVQRGADRHGNTIVGTAP